MGKRLTTEEFIEKAKKIHGDKYDYSRVEYRGDKVNVCIICPIHGKFWQTPHSHTSGCGCNECANEIRRRLRGNTQDFIARAQKVHGDFYDYSKVEYISRREKVSIICPIHGVFEMLPPYHLYGQGCPKCKGAKMSKARIGRLLAVGGRNDLVMGEYDPKSYNHWMSMLVRCYGSRVQGAYKDCSVCEEWMVFSGFNKWFNEQQYKYQEEYHLDKDILIKGNKVYSPNTCCLVPPEINVSLTRRPKKNRDLPIGVYHSKNNKRFFAVIDVNRKQVRLGTFDTIEEAFLAYKKARESQIKILADKYKDLIDPHVYEALYDYKVEITD